MGQMAGERKWRGPLGRVTGASLDSEVVVGGSGGARMGSRRALRTGAGRAERTEVRILEFEVVEIRSREALSRSRCRLASGMRNNKNSWRGKRV
jgi:hypothetical protein